MSKNNKKIVKDTFDQITMSEQLYRKVRNMSEKQNKKRKYTYRFATVMATLALVFVSGNAIVHATTGDSLIERITVYLNGERVSNDVLKKSVDEEGNINYEMEVDEDSSGKIEIVTDEVELEKNDLSVGVNMDEENEVVSMEFTEGKIVEREDKIYLLVGQEQKEIDITDDLSDGTASGEFILDEVTYQYSVKGDAQENSVSIQRVEE